MGESEIERKSVQLILILENVVHVHNVRVVNELHDDHLTSNALHNSFRFKISFRISFSIDASDMNLGHDLDRRQLACTLVPSEPDPAYQLR